MRLVQLAVGNDERESVVVFGTVNQTLFERQTSVAVTETLAEAEYSGLDVTTINADYLTPWIDTPPMVTVTLTRPADRTYPTLPATLDRRITDRTGRDVRLRVRYTDYNQLRQFARITSDTNALHLNDAFAQHTRFGRRILHGTLVAGLISAALATFPDMTIYLSQELEFVAPADIGDTFTARCRIVDALANDRYRVATHVENDEPDTIIQGTATILLDEFPHQT